LIEKLDIFMGGWFIPAASKSHRGAALQVPSLMDY
jgi:hypothetical protein